MQPQGNQVRVTVPDHPGDLRARHGKRFKHPSVMYQQIVRIPLHQLQRVLFNLGAHGADNLINPFQLRLVRSHLRNS